MKRSRPRANFRFALGLGFAIAGLVACTGVGASKGVERPRREEGAGGKSRPAPSVEKRETGKFPAFCADSSAYCERVLGSRELPAKVAERTLRELGDGEPARPEALIELVNRLVENESFSYATGGEAVRKGRAVLLVAERRKSTPEARLLLAELELSLGDAPSAGARLSALRSEFPLEAGIHGALGVSLLAQGKVEASLEPLGRAAVLDPKSAERKLVLGSARMLFGDNVGAEAAFREALEIAPNSFKAKSDLGSVLLLLGRVEEGREFLEAASKLEPERATIQSNLAYANLLLGDGARALECAERATRLDPELGSAWLNLGLAKARAKNYRGAREAFEKAKALDPTDPRALENLTELDALEKR